MYVYTYKPKSALNFPSSNLVKVKKKSLFSFLFKLQRCFMVDILKFRVCYIIHICYWLPVFAKNVLVTLHGKTLQSAISLTKYHILFHDFPLQIAYAKLILNI